MNSSDRANSESQYSVNQLDPATHFTGVSDLIGAWLGPMPSLPKIDFNEQRNVQIQTLPDGKLGESLFLGQTVVDALLINHKFLTERVMPLYNTDQLVMHWEIFEANAHLLDITPYMTTSHAVTQKRAARRARLMRHGISAEFEGDMLNSDRGRFSVMTAMAQIVGSTQQSIELEIIRTLATSHRYQADYVRKSGIGGTNMLRYFMEQDRRRFAIAQKDDYGLEKLDLLISDEMRAWGGMADTYLVPRSIKTHNTIAPPEKKFQYLGGDMAPMRALGLPYNGQNPGNPEENPNRFDVGGNTAYIIDIPRIENVPPEQLNYMRRSRQIGEYVPMIDNCLHPEKYTSLSRSIMMYDQDIDDMRLICLRDAIENVVGTFDANGNVIPVRIPPNMEETDKRDAREDFLTIFDAKGGRVMGAEYVFDIAPVFLDTKRVLNGAITLMNAAKKTDAKLLDEYDPDSNIWAVRASNAVSTILGQDGFWKILDAPVDLWQNQSVRVPVVATNVKDADARINAAISQVIMAAVPPSKKTEAENILSQQNVGMETKIDSISSMLKDSIRAKTPGIMFVEAENVDEWAENRKVAYNKKKAEIAASATAGEEKLMPAGQDLSGTGYRYKYPASARPARDGLDMIPAIRLARDIAESRAAEQQSYSAMRPSGQSRGLAGIGQFDKETFGSINRPEERLTRGEKALEILQNRASMSFAKHIELLEEYGASEMQKAFARVYLMMRLTKQNLLRLERHNVAVPMNFLLFRPHMQYSTSAIIKCQSGGGSGIVPIGNSNLMVEHSAMQKKALAHFTTHYRAVPLYPQNIHVAPDVKSEAVEGGAGCRFYTEDSYREMNNDNLVNSLICVPIPATECNFPDVIDAAGRFYVDYEISQQVEMLHYSTAVRANLAMRFRDKGRADSETPTLLPGRKTHVNRRMYQGHYQEYNNGTGKWDIIHVNKGHWDKNVYAGCREIRDGKLAVFKEQQYTTHAN